MHPEQFAGLGVKPAARSESCIMQRLSHGAAALQAGAQALGLQGSSVDLGRHADNGFERPLQIEWAHAYSLAKHG